MCGIAGIWNISGNQLGDGTLRRFTDSIAHRGPDGAGYEIVENGSLGFGHRRLSILDLTEAGKQPMYSEDGSLMITFNGEVYNFIEIRNELKEKGHSFKTETDTEVILCAYQKWGIDCFKRFNGMFAIAIWDLKLQELLMVRDRFGVKPLHYLYLPGKIFAFCSETIAFKNLDGFQREIDDSHMHLALTQPDLLEGSDKTIFKNIHQLLPGHYLKLKKNSAVNVKQWWDTEKNLGPVPQRYEEQVERFRELFEDACRLRMRSDVTLASALSGGLDSSSVYCTLHKIGNDNKNERLPQNWQQAFVATFPNTTVDEKQYAEKVVKHINGRANYIIPDYSNLVSDIVKATVLFDGVIASPITSISDIYKAMRRNGVTVSMDGHGVDEMMFGYNTYVYQAFYDSLARKDFRHAEEYARTICGLSPGYKMEDFKAIIKQFDRNIFEKGVSFLKNRIGPSRSGAEAVIQEKEWFHKVNPNLIAGITAHHKVPDQMWPAEKTMYDDFHYKSLPINLRDFDRASMQHGIEIRMPFMDYRLVSYVFSLPRQSKLSGGFTKRILRDAMKNTLPEDIRTRTLKIGIAAPLQEWFSNELKEFVVDTINSEAFVNSPYWKGKNIREAMETAYTKNKLDKAICSKAWSAINAHLVVNGN